MTEDEDEPKICPRCVAVLTVTYKLMFCMADGCDWQDGWETFDDMYNDNEDPEYD